MVTILHQLLRLWLQVQERNEANSMLKGEVGMVPLDKLLPTASIDKGHAAHMAEYWS